MEFFKKAKDIKVGVIGYGGMYNMGKVHLDGMHKAGMTPVAVTELDKKRLKVAESDFPGICTYSSVKEMLSRNNVNLVTIITPHNTHAKLGIQCLNAGRHIVCEKPLAITTKEVDSMIAAAAKNGVMLSTYHNRHWDGCIREAVKRIREKDEIGEVVGITAQMTGYRQPGNLWRSSKSISGGILYDWGVHLLEYSLQLIDSEFTEVTGFAHNGFWAPKTALKDDTNEDDAMAIVRFKSGQRLTLHFSSLDAKPGDAFLEIQGTKGVYSINRHSFNIIKKSGKKTTTIQQPNPDDKWDNYYKNVAEYMTGKEDLIIDCAWSRRPVHIIDLAVQSAKKGKTLQAKDSFSGVRPRG
ncbi:MAG: Gfo/Idh/MocA family oxidoreductase [Opitutales bacterium]|nr:Gfo/Idh/MocA family oxidoreductase [Opitutales bacterium]